ncbi:MAG TPA: hypothetical protein VLJ19_21445 [Variovorax sp.]|nr:hypothetical protein [Variovorax sp.]
MDNDDDSKTPTPPAGEKNYAQPSSDSVPDALASASIRDSVREGLREARAARAYAQDAVNASGKKIRQAGERWGALRWQGEHYVTDQPVRAALIAAAGGALLTAVFIALLRGGRR